MTGKRVSDKIASGVQIPLTPLKTALSARFFVSMIKVSKGAKKSLRVAKKPQNERKE